ncbi:unnamed protein product, partial [Allacma fusca]
MLLLFHVATRNTTSTTLRPGNPGPTPIVVTTIPTWIQGQNVIIKSITNR